MNVQEWVVLKSGGNGGIKVVYPAGFKGNKLYGGNATIDISQTYSGGGGGGGYYGGGSGNSNNYFGGPGGGGSGFINHNKILYGFTSTHLITEDLFSNAGLSMNNGLIIFKLTNKNISNYFKITLNFFSLLFLNLII